MARIIIFIGFPSNDHIIANSGEAVGIDNYYLALLEPWFGVVSYNV